jgi:hypothetical protein
MVGEQTQTPPEREEQLRRLRKTDPDPRVRRRAHGVVLMEQGHTLGEQGPVLWHGSPSGACLGGPLRGARTVGRGRPGTRRSPPEAGCGRLWLAFLSVSAALRKAGHRRLVSR